jgi:iron complex transport system substrate-binding protein
MSDLRIVSFLPSATEMIFALGLGDNLVGVSYACDFPPAAKTKTVVVRNALPLETMTLREIDIAVAEYLRSGSSLYRVDEKQLCELAPDLIVTQDLCQVCAPSGNEVSQVLKSLPREPQILWQTPHSLENIFDTIRELGEATGRQTQAEDLIASGKSRIEKIASISRTLKYRPRVFCCEWVDPIYCSGHWVPEMAELAGGIDSLSRKGSDSVRISWDEVLQWAPEIFVISPCGFNLEKTLEQTPHLFSQPGWRDLPAVKAGRVYAVDANSHFARPGPRVVEGTELVAHLFHPEFFGWNGSVDAFQRVSL